MKKITKKSIFSLFMVVMIFFGLFTGGMAVRADDPRVSSGKSLRIEKNTTTDDGNPDEEFEFHVSIWKEIIPVSHRLTCRITGVDQNYEILHGENAKKFHYTVILGNGYPGSTITAYRENSDDGSTWIRTDETLTFEFDSAGSAVRELDLANNQSLFIFCDWENITFNITQDPDNDYTTYINTVPGYSDSGTINNTASDFTNDGGHGTTPACFVAGTLIHTDNGTVPIEEVKTGDIVMAYDAYTGENAFVEVENTIAKSAEEIYVIRAGDELIKVTSEHEMYIFDQERYVPVKDLNAGDLLRTRDGVSVPIDSVELLSVTEDVYNLQIAGLSNYYVTETGFLTYNMNIPDENGVSEIHPDSRIYTQSSGDGVEAYIPVSQVFTQDDAPEGKSVTYKLTALNGAPLPSGGTGTEYLFEIDGTAETVIPIAYTAEGTYTYSICVVPDDREGYIFDTSEYTINVYVQQGITGLTADIIIYDLNGGKVSNAEFVNGYGDDDPFIDPDAISPPLTGQSMDSDAMTGILRTASYDFSQFTRYLDLSGYGEPVSDLPGTYRVKIKRGESLEIPNIPDGFQYEVYEVKSDGQKALPGDKVKTDWELYSQSNTTGTFNGADNTAGFTNRYSPDAKHVLTVNKAVTGNLGEKYRKFDFKVKVTNGSEVLDLTSYGGTANRDGSYGFKLANNDSLVISDIPAGCAYEITETDYSADGYTTYVDGAQGRAASGTLTEDTVHAFINYKNAVIPTGRNNGRGSYRIWLLLACAAGLCVAALFKKPQKRHDAGEL